MLALILPLFLLTAPKQTAPPVPPPVLWLSTKGYHSDKPGVDSSSSGKTLFANRMTPFITYRTPGACGFSAGGFTQIDPAAVLGWEVLALPKLVTADRVTLSVTWTRERFHKIEARGSMDVLLRPGESVVLDVAETADAAKEMSCNMTAAELRLELDPVHWALRDAQKAGVVSTEMWLVRKLPSGAEETQQLVVRSALNEEVPFYFDEVKSGSLAMAVLGRISARATPSGGVTLDFSGQRLVRDGNVTIGSGFTDLRSGTSLRFESPQDVVSVEFPLANNVSWKELGSQKLSIRIKSHRIR